MRLSEWLGILAVSALLLSGCSRSAAYVKVDSKRKPAGQVAPDYRVSDSPQTRQRIQTSNRLGLAGQHLRSGDLDAAEKEVRTILKADPASVDAHTLMAIIESQRGRSTQAGNHYKQAAELAPGSGTVQNNYGAWLCANGYAAESLVWFDRALNDPGYATPASALANAGGCALETGQHERAERDLRQALALDPGNAYALASMARNEYRNGRYFEARAFTERYLATASSTPDMLKLAADIEAKLGARTAADRYLQQLHTQFPASIEAQAGRKAEP